MLPILCTCKDRAWSLWGSVRDSLIHLTLGLLSRRHPSDFATCETAARIQIQFWHISEYLAISHLRFGRPADCSRGFRSMQPRRIGTKCCRMLRARCIDQKHDSAMRRYLQTLTSRVFQYRVTCSCAKQPNVVCLNFSFFPGSHVSIVLHRQETVFRL